MKSGIIALLLIGILVIYLQVIKPRLEMPAMPVALSPAAQTPVNRSAPVAEKPPAPPLDFSKTPAATEPPHDETPIAADVEPEQEPMPTQGGEDFVKAQRAKGLVLWKGEWMLPEERAAKRKAEDDAKTALNKPRQHKPAPPPPEEDSVADDPQPLAPGQFRQVDVPGPARFIGPRGGTGHFSKNGKKVYDKKSEVELPQVASRSLFASGILFHNIPRVVHGCQTYVPQTDSAGHQVFTNGEAVYNEYIPDIAGNGVCNVTDFQTVSAGIINIGERYFYVDGAITRGQYRIVDLKSYGSDVLPVLQLAN